MFAVKPRDVLWDNCNQKESDPQFDVIYYSQKGYEDSRYFKVFLWTSGGSYYEGTGTTLDSAVDCCIAWID